MSITQFPEVSPSGDLRQTKEVLAEALQTLEWLLNGNVDLHNVRARSITADRLKAKTITANEIQADAITANEIAANAITSTEIQAGAVTADKMTVAQLSAIAADMGTLTAGIIYGALIATTSGAYPRVVLSSGSNIFQALKSATEYIAMNPNLTGKPSIEFKIGTVNALLFPDVGTFAINTLVGKLSLFAQSDDLLLRAGVDIKANCTNFSMNGLNGFTGTILAGTTNISVQNGIITGYT